MMTTNRTYPKADPKFARTTTPGTVSFRRSCVVPEFQPSIRYDVTPEQIALVTFDQPESSANVFDRDALEHLDEILGQVESDGTLKGVVFISAKPSIFIAGADLHSISRFLETEGQPPELVSLIEFGQQVFERVALLPVPTVAAIHGACVGGGFELALACTYRIASPDSATRIGLPETQLGLIPAWGGSTRLPVLIGFPAALDLILNGKVLPAAKARRVGLVDELVPREQLLEVATSRIGSGVASKERRVPFLRKLTGNRLAAKLIASSARMKVMKKTRGNYPALLKAIEVLKGGAGASVDESLSLERKAILDLAETPATRNLIRLFLLQERAKRLNAVGHYSLGDVPPKTGAIPPASGPRIQKASVIGAGVMGAGIAHWLSSKGVAVQLKDLKPEFVARGMTTISDLYAKAVKHRLVTPVDARKGLDRVSPIAGDAPLAAADIVIEAAVEKMDVKKDIFRRLAESTGERTILATNTSALSISELAAATRAPDRVAGLHFFNPVHRMQLVEVVTGADTSPEVTARLVRFVQDIGKLPVVVNDSPGFVVNRILMPYLVEAGVLFEQGARVKDIDEAMLDFGMPMGPMRLIDEVGVDVAWHVAQTLAGSFPNRMFVPEILDQMMKSGLLGRKNDHGFYLHNGDEPAVNEGVNVFRKGASAADLSRESLRRRMVLLMVNEAARCLEERVVVAAADVDFAMVMGTGFAPFHGGPLRYADTQGIATLVAEMNQLVREGQAHFRPCDLLTEMAGNGSTFYPGKGVRR